MARVALSIAALLLVFDSMPSTSAIPDSAVPRASVPRSLPPELRVLVHHDMEGLTGQHDWRSAAAWWPEQYAHGQRLLAEDVNAVVAGLIDGGVTVIDVLDQHGSGNPGLNLPPALLHPRVRKHLHRHDAPPRSPGAYDAIVMVAMHPKTGSGGFMAHTGTFGVERLINGRSISEAEFAAYAWGEAGVPVIFVSGDDRLRSDLISVMPWLEYVVTKRSLSPDSVELRPTDLVRSELRAAARRAVLRLAEMKPLRVATPVRAGVRAVPPADLSGLADVPGINYADGGVFFEAASYPEAAKGIIALQRIAAEGGRHYMDDLLSRDPLWARIGPAAEAGFWELWMSFETRRTGAPERPKAPRPVPR